MLARLGTALLLPRHELLLQVALLLLRSTFRLPRLAALLLPLLLMMMIAFGMLLANFVLPRVATALLLCLPCMCRRCWSLILPICPQ
jgi:hypothetical protein